MINMFHFPNFEDMTMLQNGQKLDQFDKIIFCYILFFKTDLVFDPVLNQAFLIKFSCFLDFRPKFIRLKLEAATKSLGTFFNVS